MIEVEHIDSDTLQVLRQTKVVGDDEVLRLGSSHDSSVSNPKAHELGHVGNIGTLLILLAEELEALSKLFKVPWLEMFAELARKVAYLGEDMGCSNDWFEEVE